MSDTEVIMKGQQVSLRDEYGSVITSLGEVDNDIVVLDADLSSSTRTSKFKAKFPDRFFNMGVAEANMISTAAGLASAGKKPFASTFAVFASGRAWDQVRQSVCLSNLNVKIVATHGGITVGEDGPSHQALEDIAIMRVLPNMSVVIPSDALETRAVIKSATKTFGPLYVRLARAKFPLVHDDEPDFELGKGEKLRAGSDVAIIACGVMVSKALESAENLAKRGIEATVINMASIKPIDEKLIIDSAKECGAIVTAEEHSVMAGLGSAVAEVTCEASPVPVVRVGMNDSFGKSGPPDKLLDFFGMNNSSIEAAVDRSIGLKQK